MVLIDLDGGDAQLRDLQRLRVGLADVPALLLSAQSEEQLQQRGFRLGPMDYLLRSL
jgi:PleD family two-component response regulator